MKIKIDNDSLLLELKKAIGDNNASIMMPQDIFIDLPDNAKELEIDGKTIWAEEIIYDIRIDGADKDILVEISIPQIQDTVSNFQKVEILN